MDKERNNKNCADTPNMLQWGSSKRHRGIKVKSKHNDKASNVTNVLSSDTLLGDNKDGSRDAVSGFNKETSVFDHRVVDRWTASPASHQTVKNSSSPMNKHKTSARLPNKEDRYPHYTTRGLLALDESGYARALRDYFSENKGGPVVPKLILSLSSKEKEEDFMAMKVPKLPQRPKKRPKSIQRSVHLASPGTWLPDVRQERYEIRQKKTSKKTPKGLKAMVGNESDSD